MTIKEVILACQTVAEKGKTPTIALVKAHLPNHLPLAMVIKGVKQYLANPSRTVETPASIARQKLDMQEPQYEPQLDCKCLAKIQLMQSQIEHLKLEITNLQVQVAALSRQ